jgi:hypothetical protein
MLALLALVACPAPDDTDTNTAETCEPRALVAPTPGFFADISDASGIRVDNFYSPAPAGMVINDHSRLAFADLDGDGLDEAVMHSLYPNATNGVPFEHLVFHNNGDGTFTDASDASGLRAVQAAFFAFADVDDDGDQDLYAGLDYDGLPADDVGIWLNDGAGTFTHLEDAGVETRDTMAANAVFFDMNLDGDVDLFVGNGGTSYGARDEFYFGNGDGTFTSASLLFRTKPAQPTNGSTACDWDDDGDQDVFAATYGVSIDNGVDHLWQNNNDEFVDVGASTGFFAEGTGNYWLSSTGNGRDLEDVDPADFVGGNGFGVDCGDVDGDGDLDILLAQISHSDADYSRKWSDPSLLLVNDGSADHRLTNVWLDRDLPYNEGDIDAAFTDLDNDGRLDISLSRDRKYESRYDVSEIDQQAWFGLYHQQPDGQFVSVGYQSGVNDPEAGLLRMKSAQNHAWSDIDGDGDLDLLVGGRDQGGGRPNFLFRNDLGQQNRWLEVGLEGDGEVVSRDAFGARLTVFFTDGTRLVREKKSSRGMYNSEDTRVQHVGLGDRPCIDHVEVRWPDGSVGVWSGAEVGEDQRVTLSWPDGLLVEP